MPGFVDVFAMHEPGGRSVSISYWDSVEAIENWRDDERHRLAKQKGKAVWYDHFSIEICKIENSKNWERDRPDSQPE